MHGTPREGGPSDFQQLYKRHVHENMVLHERLRGLDSVERSRLRQLDTNTAQFRGKYQKYLPQRQAAAEQGAARARGAGAQGKHRAPFLVCKNFAYPAKAWHGLVDVSKPGLDLYKTEILTSTAGERPEAPVTRTIHRDSAGLLNVYTIPRKTHSDSADKTDSNSRSRRKRYDKYDAEKSNTLPSIVISESPPRDSALPLTRELTSIITQWKSDNAIDRHRDELPSLTLTPDRDGRPSRRASSNPSPRDRPLSPDYDSGDARAYRGRSHTVGSSPRPAPLLERRRDSGRRRSMTAVSRDLSPGWQKVKRKAQLISISTSLLNDAREIQIKRIAKSFEDLSHCRYLRLEDDVSVNLGRDNFTYSREKLNSSSEDIH